MLSTTETTYARVRFLNILFLIALPAAIACRPERAAVEDLYTARMLGLSYLERNQLPEAEAEFRKLTQMAPDDPLGYTNLGLTYLQGGKYADAEKALARARELDPGNIEVGLALARLYSLTARSADARKTLERLRSDSARNAPVLYALAELDATRRDTASARRYEQHLTELLAISPANLAARVKLIDALARRGKADDVIRQLEEVRRIPPEPPREARVYLDSSIQLLRAGRIAESRVVLEPFFRLMEGTAPYQASLEDVKWPEGPIPGRAILTFAPKDFISLRETEERTTTEVVRFTEVTSDALLPDPDPNASARPGSPLALAAGDVDGDGTDDLFASLRSAGTPGPSAHLFRVQNGLARDVTSRSGISLPNGAAQAAFTDYDNDGWLDLFVIGGEGRGRLFRNSGTGTFTDVTAKAGITRSTDAMKPLFVDLDHDGDLDLFLVSAGERIVYRNNLDGTFTEATAGFGLSGGGANDAAFADFDRDGRMDIIVANAGGGIGLLRNGGVTRFSDVAAPNGLTASTSAGAMAIGDYDNDGSLDLFASSTDGSESLLWLNKGGTFSPDRRSAAAFQAMRGVAGHAATFVDYDNDGWLDLLVGGTGRTAATKVSGVFLFRNDGTGRFADRSTLIPAAVRSAGAFVMTVSDVDDDGDEDFVLVDSGGAIRLLRNELGNSKLAVKVELKGLRTGSGKNNALGIGARLELRAGNIYQTRVATGRVTHFGLGPHLKADVLRVEWPNGVPQTVYLPGTDADVVEREMLKGSCAFAYTWDGERFRFVTDAMWRSALGMPLGLMGSTSAFAPAGASQEYVRIPGDALKPRDGRYILQLTEELWETAYADEVKLIAVDHPDSVDVFVDERFVPPGPVSLKVFQIAQRFSPLSAVDERGNDVLPALRDHDDVYVANLEPSRYQGVVREHDLIIDLGPAAGEPGTFLFLRGWIYPTDASINVALSQQPSIKVAPPSLEIRNAKGEWQTAVASIGFPSGKDKTMVIDLAGRFPTADHRVRLRTSMQIYWDQAFVSRELPDNPVRVTTLTPVAADLHFRGFSRMYRKGGRYGPYWFAYDDVAKESPWLPIEGAFTRFGDILPLLKNADDMYVIMAPGDEATIQFDAASARSVPPGWKRDFLLYTDGWIKDSDLNTAFGTTVDPLPFHAVRSYPYQPGESYPSTPEHRRYQREYNTRVVRRSGSTGR
ncbi:MAG TPA: FG-GAP-like repeat-containing protein [Gemmatimonadaceae bacterium]|nr:FG-GAP-like repeat-containing protein [Gemmatimonadaceae bacterium]